MKICVLAHAYVDHGRNAGGETTLHDCLKYLAGRGAEVKVILDRKTTYKSPTVVDGVLVIPYDEFDNGRFNVECRTADVVLSHLDCSERATFVAEACNVPMVHLVHNTFWQTEGYLSQGCNLAIYNTEWAAAHHNKSRTTTPLAIVSETPTAGQTTAVFNFRARKVSQWPFVVVHPPIDPDRYKTTPGDHITLVNLWENKGPDVFYEMADAFPDQKFLGVKGGYADKDQDIRDRPNVTIVPNRNDFRDILRKTKIVLMPSKYESFGRVAIEAGASGIPTVASPTEGLREALGEDGYYASSLADWESQISKLLTPAGYTRASKLAKLRSAYWAERVPAELDTLWEELIAMCTAWRYND